MTNTCELPDALADLPPTRNHVYRALEDFETPVTRTDLSHATGLSDRTVERALSDLVDADLVTTDPDPQDARKRRYTTQ